MAEYDLYVSRMLAPLNDKISAVTAKLDEQIVKLTEVSNAVTAGIENMTIRASDTERFTMHEGITDIRLAGSKSFEAVVFNAKPFCNGSMRVSADVAISFVTDGRASRGLIELRVGNVTVGNLIVDGGSSTTAITGTKHITFDTLVVKGSDIAVSVFASTGVAVKSLTGTVSKIVASYDLVDLVNEPFVKVV